MGCDEVGVGVGQGRAWGGQGAAIGDEEEGEEEGQEEEVVAGGRNGDENEV